MMRLRNGNCFSRSRRTLVLCERGLRYSAPENEARICEKTTMNMISPTSYPDVNEILDLLLNDVKAILQDQLIGMYLHGSLANGGFDEYSDIDIIFVTENIISEEKFDALKSCHEMISVIDSPWRNQLEVSYIHKDALRRFDPLNNSHPHLDRGTGEKLHIMSHESDWVVQRYILRERGIVVLGPDPKTVVDEVTPNDLRKAVAEGLPLWINPILNNPSEIHKRGYQSFFVLSLCRILYTLRQGKILSKSEAAEWAKENLEKRWTPLIERALIGRKNPDEEAALEDIHETLEMMRYALQQIQPTLYPEVNEVLHLLLSKVKEILADQFTGMYLYGSLSSGDFDPETSDIDFLVITTDVLAENKISELESMHQRIWNSGLKWASHLEGAYIPMDLIRQHDSKGVKCPTFNEGKFYVAPLGSDWIIQRHVVRELGVVVEGPDPRTLIDFVSTEDIRYAVKGILEEWWFPMLENPTWLRDHGSAYHAFAILSMCRALYAWEYGIIISKPVAAKWAKQKLEANWSLVIDRALFAQKPHPADSELLNEAIGLIRYTKDHIHEDQI